MRRDEDPYSLLGVRRQASADEINRAYRRAARETHPDAHPADDSAGPRFRAMTDAYETLRDPGRRAAYDRAHPVVRRVAGASAPRAAPPPVRLGPPRPGAASVQLGPRPPGAWPDPVSLGPVRLGPQPHRRPSTHAEADLLDVVDALARLLRGGWLRP